MSSEKCITKTDFSAARPSSVRIYLRLTRGMRAFMLRTYEMVPRVRARTNRYTGSEEGTASLRQLWCQQLDSGRGFVLPSSTGSVARCPGIWAGNALRGHCLYKLRQHAPTESYTARLKRHVSQARLEAWKRKTLHSSVVLGLRPQMLALPLILEGEL